MKTESLTIALACLVLGLFVSISSPISGLFFLIIAGLHLLIEDK